MTSCPKGHQNPDGWEFCGECGKPVEPSVGETIWGTRRGAVVASFFAGLVVSAVVALVAVVVGSSQPDLAADSTEDQMAVSQWWSEAQEPFTKLQNALDDSRRAADLLDDGKLATACQEMHDAAAVGLPAHLPAPDAELTRELTAAADDAHEAAHMCLSVMMGSMNQYGAEFKSRADQTNRHLSTVQAVINRVAARHA